MQQTTLPVEPRQRQPRRKCHNRGAPDPLVGKLISVRMDDDNKYTGVVTRFDSIREKYLLVWDDDPRDASGTEKQKWYIKRCSW